VRAPEPVPTSTVAFHTVVVTFEGRQLVAFEPTEAEQLLDLIERKLPKAQRAITKLNALVVKQDELLRTREAELAATRELVQTQQERADVWKATAESLQPKPFDQAITALKWLLAGAGVGVLVYAKIDQ